MIIRAILESFDLEILLLLFALINALLILVLFNNIKYWGIGYTIGWIFGLILFASIISPIELAIYIIIFVIAIVIKAYNKISYYV